MGLFDRLARGLRRGPAGDAPPSAPVPENGQTAELAERRKHQRLGVGAPTIVVLPGQPSGVQAFIRDISKGGCLLDAQADLRVGSRVSLAFLSKVCGHCHAMGCVVRTTGKSGFGVEFTKVNMAFLGFVGSVNSASPEARNDLIAAMRGSTVEITSGA